MDQKTKNVSRTITRKSCFSGECQGNRVIRVTKMIHLALTLSYTDDPVGLFKFQTGHVFLNQLALCPVMMGPPSFTVALNSLLTTLPLRRLKKSATSQIFTKYLL